MVLAIIIVDAGQWPQWNLFKVCNQDQRSKSVWQPQLASTVIPVVTYSINLIRLQKPLI